MDPLRQTQPRTRPPLPTIPLSTARARVQVCESRLGLAANHEASLVRRVEQLEEQSGLGRDARAREQAAKLHERIALAEFAIDPAAARRAPRPLPASAPAAASTPVARIGSLEQQLGLSSGDSDELLERLANVEAEVIRPQGRIVGHHRPHAGEMPIATMLRSSSAIKVVATPEYDPDLIEWRRVSPRARSAAGGRPPTLAERVGACAADGLLVERISVCETALLGPGAFADDPSDRVVARVEKIETQLGIAPNPELPLRSRVCAVEEETSPPQALLLTTGASSVALAKVVEKVEGSIRDAKDRVAGCEAQLGLKNGSLPLIHRIEAVERDALGSEGCEALQTDNDQLFALKLWRQLRAPSSPLANRIASCERALGLATLDDQADEGGEAHAPRGRRATTTELTPKEARLIEAARQGRTGEVVELIAQGANVNCHSKDLMRKDDQTPLSWAAFWGHAEVVGALLEAGAQADVTDQYSNSPLSWAASFGHTEILRALLRAGASVNLADSDGGTPLRKAAYNGHLEVVNELLTWSALPDLASKDGTTPLCWAAYYGRADIVKALLKAGAVEAKERALEMACQGGGEANLDAVVGMLR